VLVRVPALAWVSALELVLVPALELALVPVSAPELGLGPGLVLAEHSRPRPC